MELIFVYLYFICIATFAIYGYDKHLAIYNCRRVPEWLMLGLAIIGGAFGALCAMILFAHKTQHKSFMLTVPIALVVQLAIIILLRVI